MQWNTYSECIKLIRPYNIEKLKIITDIYKTVTQYNIMTYSV